MNEYWVYFRDMRLYKFKAKTSHDAIVKHFGDGNYNRETYRAELVDNGQLNLFKIVA